MNRLSILRTCALYAAILYSATCCLAGEANTGGNAKNSAQQEVNALANSLDKPDGDVIRMDELTVVSDKLEEFARRNPESVEIIAEKALAEGKYRNVVDAVSTVPGVTVRERRGSAPTVSLRGQGFSRLLVLIDGRAVGGAGGSEFDLGSLSIDSIKRIEIYKPPVPVWLGAGASGGAINIVTKSRGSKSDATADSEHKHWSGKAKVYGGSYGLAGTQASVSHVTDKHSLFATVRATRSDGKRPNQESQKGSASVKMSWKNVCGGELQAGIKVYDVRRETAGTIYNPREDAWHHLKTGSIDLQWQKALSDSLQYLAQFRLGTKDVRDRVPSGTYYDMDSYAPSLRQRLTWTPTDHWAIQAGLDLDNETMLSDVSGTHHRDVLGMYLQEEYENGPWNLRFGQRADRYSDFGWRPGFDFGIARRISERLAAKSNLGYTEKVPSFTRMYQSTHDSVLTIEGNPDLQPEQAASGDLKLEWKFSSQLNASVGGFYSRTWDYITYESRDPDPSKAFNYSRVDIGGLELGMRWKPNKKHNLTLGYTFKDGHAENGNDLRYCRRHESSLTWNWSLPKSCRLQTRMRYGSAVYSDMDNTEDKRVGDFCHIDVMASRKVGLTEYYFKIDNLLDDEYHVHYGYPAEGITFQLGVERSF